MSGNMAWKAGKGAFQKFSGKNADEDPTIRTVDSAHYRGALVEKREEGGQTVLVLNTQKTAKKHRKDSAYYEYKGIPEKDAKILSKIVVSARFLDNGIRIPFIGYKIGVNTFIELIPALGDSAGSALGFLLVVLPSTRVSKGPDTMKLKKVMMYNLSKGFFIGLLPIGGDIIDTMKKYNVRNADALETMLLKRADKVAKTGQDAEKVVRTTGYQHAGTIGHHVAATNGNHDSAPSTRRFLNANDLRQNPKPVTTAQAPVVQAPPKKGGGFLRRGEPQGRQEGGTAMEEVAPVHPPRPKQSVHERGGYF